MIVSSSAIRTRVREGSGCASSAQSLGRSAAGSAGVLAAGGASGRDPACSAASRSSSAEANGAWSSRTSASDEIRLRLGRHDGDRAGRQPLADASRAPTGSARQRSGIRRSQRAEAISEAPRARSRREGPRRSMARTARMPPSRLSAEQAGLGEDEPERGAARAAHVRLLLARRRGDGLAGRLPSRAPGRGGRRRGGVRGRVALGAELGEGGVERRPGEQEVVDRGA